MKNKRKIICWAALGALLLCAAVVLALTRGRGPEPAISPNAPSGAPTEPADPTALPVETSRPPESTAPTEMPSTGRPAASTDPEPSGETTGENGAATGHHGPHIPDRRAARDRAHRRSFFHLPSL